MSIVAVQSVTLLGLVGEKERVLEDLQEMGCLHLRTLKPDEALRAGGEKLSEETREAWRFLNDCPNKRLQVGRSRRFDPARMQSRALEIKARLEDLTDERDFLAARIEDVREWGDFDFSPDEKMAGHHLWFYIVPNYRMPKVEESDFIWERIKRDDRFTYIIVISETEPKDMPVERVHIGSHSLTELQIRLEEVELEIDDLQFEREGLTRGLRIYERNMNRLEDVGRRAEAASQTLDNETLFALQAWIPEERAPEIEAYASDKGLALTVADPAPEEDPPTLLRNPDRWRVGESLVQFYMTPGYRLWDPSLVVLFSFTLFFAMIISDAGYGMLMLGLLFLARRKLAATPAGRNLRTLLLLLSVSTVAWGVLVASYFGVEPPAGSLPGKFKILDLGNMGAMMALSVAIGGAHVILANAMDAWRQRDSASALAPVGWIVVVLSGLLLGFVSTTGTLGEAGRTIGIGGLVTGFLMVFLFHGALPGNGWGKRLLSGLLSLANVTNAFGDVLSYLRLFALGLASASLAVAFNDLASQARAGIGGLGVLVAILILVVGHGLNFVLAIVSGVVHGLRLNLIEFFNWSVPEEGRPFRPFEKKEKLT